MYAQTAHVHRTTRTVRRRPNGLGHLGLTAAPLPPSLWGQLFSKIAPILGPVGFAISAGYGAYSLVRLFQSWSERGELKIAATAKAEEFVQSIWGTLQPNSPPTSDSASKLIEECRLTEADAMIKFLARQMYEKGNEDPYFKKWVEDWGWTTLLQINSKLAAYVGYCANNEPIQPSPSAQCPSGFTLQSGVCRPIACPDGFYLKNGVCTPLSPATLPPAIDSTGGYVPISSGLSGGSMFAILAALLAVIVISR